MSLERYLKDDQGFRKYVELLESTPPKKRQTLADLARKENALFVETAEKYLLTFDRITKLPEMELTEVLGAEGLKTEILAVAISTAEHPELKERLLQNLPRNLTAPVQLALKELPVPKPADIGAARLQLILKALEL